MNDICSGPRNIEQKNPLHSAKMMPFIALPYNYLMIMDLLILGPLQVDFSRDAIEHKFTKKKKTLVANCQWKMCPIRVSTLYCMARKDCNHVHFFFRS